ncbi:class III lanthionine synthetase LanKC [Shewanella algae]|uniref:class III lanthionine synthetase LanKC n=1 Tax=Shewanella algae TaxID=38313 RepID=UPI00313ECAEA
MYWIERRAGRAVFNYTMLKPSRYSNLGDYRSSNSSYLRLVSNLLPADWKLHYQKGIWCNVQAPEHSLVNSGFKIHLSTAFKSATEMLRIVVPALVEQGVTFKFLVDTFALTFINSQTCSKASSGKFITIYPSDLKQFHLIIDVLKPLTAKFEGPYILSDQRVPGSQVLFYRYGAFVTKSRTNLYGEQELLMQLPNGDWVKDSRSNQFYLPEGISDPFDQDNHHKGEIVLNNRYSMNSWLADSNKGGVYKGIDRQNGDEIVVKEVRPFINENEHGHPDALALLDNETQALTRLANTGVVPRVIERFDEWENSFLVLEMLPGSTLANLRAQEDFALLLMTNPNQQQIREFYLRFLGIAELLLNAIEKAHQAGVIIVDLAPQNIIYDREQHKLWLIDLEAANIQEDDSPKIKIATYGYANLADVRDGKFSNAIDYSAASNVLYNLIFPANELLVLNPGSRAPMLNMFMEKFGGTQEILNFILKISENIKSNQQLLVEAHNSLASVIKPLPNLHTLDDSQLSSDKDAICSTIITNTNAEQSEFSYRPDYRVYSGHSLALVHGITGIIWTLIQLGKSIPDAWQTQYILELKRQDFSSLTPGVAVGVAGIARTAQALGLPNLAKQMMEQSRHSPWLKQNADLFYGASGWGLTALHLFNQTQDPELLEMAEFAAECVLSQLKQDEHGLYIVQEKNTVFHSLAHGSAGVALFMLRLYQVTKSQRYLTIGKSLLDYEVAHADESNNFITWKRSPQLAVVTPYLRVGSAGIIEVLLAYYQQTEISNYLDVAEKAAVYLKGKLSVTSGYLNGMTGIGNTFITLFEVTKKHEYWQEAKNYADQIMVFAKRDGIKIDVIGEENIRFTDDLGSGAAGVAWFLNRVINRSGGNFYDL